jgi:hypothetical protein
VIILTEKTCVSTGDLNDFLEKIIVSCNEMKKDVDLLKANLVNLASDFDELRNNYIDGVQNAKK